MAVVEQSFPSVGEDKFAAFRDHARERVGQAPGFRPMQAPVLIPRGMGMNPRGPENISRGGGENHRGPQYPRPDTDPRGTYGVPNRGPNNGPSGGPPQSRGFNGSQSHYIGQNQPRQYQHRGPNQHTGQYPHQYGQRAHQNGPGVESNPPPNGYQRGYQNGNQNQPVNQPYEESYQEFKERRLAEKKYKTNPSFDADDLNAVDEPDYDDLNAEVNYTHTSGKKMSSLYSDEEEESDEELEDIKGELRFTRDKTIESTERTLQMAREAERLGQNTMGMLGSQSARLFSTERTLQVSQTTASLGEEYSKELRTVSDVFQAPSNPFNKKSRLRKKEEAQRDQFVKEQKVQHEQFEEFQALERRVKTHLVDSTGGQHQFRKASDAQYKQYLYEGEGEYAKRQEDTINDNMEQIHSYAKRLRGLAAAQSEEFRRQLERMKAMGDNMGRLHITVDQSSQRLKRVIQK